MTNNIESVSVIMEGLTTARMSFDSFEHCIQGNLIWGYSEFSLTPENALSLAILCDAENELSFEFRTITFRT